MTDEPRPAPPPVEEEHASTGPEPYAEGAAEPLGRPRRPDRPPLDGLAVAAFLVSLVGLHVIGVVLGHLSLTRMVGTGRRGRGLAIAALVIGYAGLALALAGWVFYFSVLAPVVTLPG